MTRYGYMRISTNEDKQSFLRQEQQLKDAGCEKIFSDTESGSKADRAGLNELLSIVQSGDCVVTVEFSRIARSVQQLISVSDDLANRNVDFISLTENINTTSPEGKLFYTIIAAFSEFELNMIRSRTKQGLEAAKKKGRVGGRPRKDQTKLNAAVAAYIADEMSVSEISKATGVSSSTLYRELDKRGIERHGEFKNA